MKGNNDFNRKTYGGIYIVGYTDEKKEAVKQIIKKLDEFEYDYLGEKIIMPFEPTEDGTLPVEYLHKFEIDKDDLCIECAKSGIHIICLDNQREY